MKLSHMKLAESELNATARKVYDLLPSDTDTNLHEMMQRCISIGLNQQRTVVEAILYDLHDRGLAKYRGDKVKRAWRRTLPTPEETKPHALTVVPSAPATPPTEPTKLTKPLTAFEELESIDTHLALLIEGVEIVVSGLTDLRNRVSAVACDVSDYSKANQEQTQQLDALKNLLRSFKL